LLTVLEGPEYSLDSQENSPRLQDQHTEDEFWYSDIEAPCQGVLDPGHKHSQDVQADRNQLVKQGLKDQLNFKSIDFSPHTTLLSHLSVLAKNSHVLRMGVHTMVKVISSMALTVGFMLLTFLASVENCVAWRKYLRCGAPSNKLTSLERFCGHSDELFRAVRNWSPGLATTSNHSTELIAQVWVVIFIAVMLFILVLIDERRCRTHVSAPGSSMVFCSRSSKTSELFFVS